MKRFFLLLLAALFCILPLTACQPKTEEADDVQAVAMRDTVLYYSSFDGYIVPVTVRLPWEEQIVKKVLELLKTPPDVGAYFEGTALVPVLPEDVKFTVDIDGGVAQLDLIGYEALNATEETNTVCCLVNTLLEFPSVEKVNITFNGKQKDRMTFGTDVSEAFSEYLFNVEDTDVSALGVYSTLTLYFLDSEGVCIVPVTREISDKPDAQTAMQQFVMGPKTKWNLSNGLPEGTKLISVKVDDAGTAEVNFSKEFEGLSEKPEREKRVVKAIKFTIMRLPGVKKVVIKVDGKVYKMTDEDPSPNTINLFEITEE